MLEGVGDQFVDNETTGDEFVHFQTQLPAFNLDVDITSVIDVYKFMGDSGEKLSGGDAAQGGRPIKCLMNAGHDHNPVPRLTKQFRVTGILDLVGLEIKQAADHVEIVFDPVVDLP